MSELERRLQSLAAEIEFPPTPDIASRVGARLAGARPAPARLPLGRAVAVAAIWALATAGTVVAASRDVSDALLDLSGLDGVTIERTDERAPAPEPRPLDLGSPTAVDEVIRKLSFLPLLPTRGGGPDEVYLRKGVPGGELNLVYEPRADLPATASGFGLLITEFRGDLLPGYLRKIAPATTTVERLRIDGSQAIWIAGAPHFFVYRAPGGDFSERDLQVAENVLLIEHGDVLVRMEGAFDRDAAVRVAGTLAPFDL